MDVFRFRTNDSNPFTVTKLEQGELINGIKSKLWIERYRDAGEFRFVGNVDSDLKTLLPIGSFISHVDTLEVMIVEDHEINEVKDKPSEIIVTGRSFETILEQRIVGSEKEFPTTEAGVDHVLEAADPSHQVKTLIDTHIQLADLVNENNEIRYVTVVNQVLTEGATAERVVQKGSLYLRVLELLAIDGLGIKVIRPGLSSPLGPSSDETVIAIHEGVNRTSTVIFSSDTGELSNAQYLWSNKKAKNAALVTGKWVEVFVTTGDTHYDRRTMYIDASDIDELFEEPPAGVDLDLVVEYMSRRAVDILAAQNNIALTKAEISKNMNNARFRVDFNVGDIVTVHGNYSENAPMQISEYVEIEDEEGEKAYPTLTMI